MEITKYCSTPKTLQEVLKKDRITNLLSIENQNEVWIKKYSQYKNAASLKTRYTNYEKTYEPFKTWCSE